MEFAGKPAVCSHFLYHTQDVDRKGLLKTKCSNIFICIGVHLFSASILRYHTFGYTSHSYLDSLQLGRVNILNKDISGQHIDNYKLQ